MDVSRAREMVAKLQQLTEEIASAIGADVQGAVSEGAGGERDASAAKKTCSSGFYCGIYKCTKPFSCSEFECTSDFKLKVIAAY